MRLKDFLGNQRLVRLLIEADLAPATIFEGPTGIGKKTLALLLATKANCQAGTRKDLCGQCGSCLRAAAGHHPDIRLYRTETASISIELMRDLSREVQFRPFSGKTRFFIVDEAEKLTEEAANSILKTLEEPPETTRIVLVTAYPQRLLPTIRSRCQSFSFSGLQREAIQTFLQQEGELDRPQLRASFCDGSLAKAIEMELDSYLEIRDALLELFDNWSHEPRFETVFDACELPVLRGRLRKRDSALECLTVLQTFCYDLYLMAVGDSNRVVHIDQVDRLKTIGGRITLDQLGDLLYHIGQARTDVERNVNPSLCFETLWLGASA